MVIGQNADHREIARFVSLHDRNLRPILSRLNIFRQEISNQLQSMASGQCTIERLDIKGMSLRKYSTCPRLTPLSVAATHAPFETPFLPCNTFQGRETLLGKMEAFFYASSTPKSSQLTFAICGLGTSTLEVPLLVSSPSTLDAILQG